MWFYAEGEAFLMSVSKMKYAEGWKFMEISFLKNKKTSKKTAHLRSVDIAITTFYQKRTESFDYTNSG